MNYGWNPNDATMDEARTTARFCNPAVITAQQQQAQQQQAMLLQAQAQAQAPANINNINAVNVNGNISATTPQPPIIIPATANSQAQILIPPAVPGQPPMVIPANTAANTAPMVITSPVPAAGANINGKIQAPGMGIQPVGAAPPFMPAGEDIIPSSGGDVAALDNAISAMDEKIDFSHMSFPDLLAGINPTAEQQLNAVAPSVIQKLNAMHAASFAQAGIVPPVTQTVAPTPPSAPPPAPMVTSKPESVPVFLTPHTPNAPVPAVAAPTSAPVMTPTPMNAAAAAMMGVSAPMNAAATAMMAASAPMATAPTMMPVSAPMNTAAVIMAVSAPMGTPVMMPAGSQAMMNPGAAVAARNPWMVGGAVGANSPVGPMDTTHPVFTQAAFAAQPNMQVPVVKVQPTPVPMPTAAQAAAAAAVATAATFVANAEQASPTAAQTNGNGRGSKKKRNPMRRTKAISWSDPSILGAVDAIKAEQRFAPVTSQPLQQLAPQLTPVPTIVPAMVAGMPTIPMVGGQMMPVMAAPGMVAAPAGGPPRLLPQVGMPAVQAPGPPAGGGAAALVKEEEERKMVRAERNRHSAAASRERKKLLLAELARQVSELSKQNADLQITQIKAVDEKRAAEKVLKQEHAELKRAMQFLDMEYSKLEHIAEEEGKGQSEYQRERRKKLERPKTWDAGSDSWRAAARLVVAQEEEEAAAENSDANMDSPSPHQ